MVSKRIDELFDQIKLAWLKALKQTGYSQLLLRSTRRSANKVDVIVEVSTSFHYVIRDEEINT